LAREIALLLLMMVVLSLTLAAGILFVFALTTSVLAS
jgi:hypothetical protein